MSFVSYLVFAGLTGIALLGFMLAAKTAFILAALSAGALGFFYLCLAPEARRAMGAAPFVLAIGMPAAAWLLSNLWLLHVALVAIIPLTARRAGQVPALYLFALMLLPGLDQSVMAGALKLFDFGVHDALALGAALTLFAHPEWRRRSSFALDVPFAALLLMLVVAMARDTSATHALRILTNHAFDFLLPYYVITRGVRNSADLRHCMLILAGVAAVLSAILVYEMVTTWPMYNILLEHFGLPERPAVKMRGNYLRAGGPFVESTSIAMVLVFCTLATWLARDRFRPGPWHGAALALVVIGLLPPQSRGAWIGLVFGVILADLYLGQWRSMALKAGAAASVSVLLFAMARAGGQLAESLGRSGNSSDTVDYRNQLLERGMQEFWQSPIIGFPHAELLGRLHDLTQGEGIVDFVNTHLFIALIGGVIGFAIFNGAILYSLVQIWRSRRWLPYADAAQRRAAAFAFAALATPVEMLFFTSLGGRVQVLLIVFLGFAVVVARRDQAAAKPNQAPAAAFTMRPTPMPPAPAAISAASSIGLRMPMRDSSIQP